MSNQNTMTYTTEHRQIPFTQVPNALLNDPNLSMKAKTLYCYIRSKPDNWKFSVKGIGSQMKEGTRAIREGLIELEKTGWLERVLLKSGGKFCGAKYITHFEPCPLKDPELFDNDVSQTEISPPVMLQNGISPDVTHSNTIGSNKELSNKEKSTDFEKNSKSGLHQKVVEKFFDFHLKEKKFRYQFSGAKDGQAIKKIISKLKNLYKDTHLRDPGDVEVLEAFDWILQKSKEMPDNWIYENLTPAIINSKLNSIIDYGKNGSSKTKRHPDLSEHLIKQGFEPSFNPDLYK